MLMTFLYPPKCELCGSEAEDYCRICRTDLCFQHALRHEPNLSGEGCTDARTGP